MTGVDVSSLQWPLSEDAHAEVVAAFEDFILGDLGAAILRAACAITRV